MGVHIQERALSDGGDPDAPRCSSRDRQLPARAGLDPLYDDSVACPPLVRIPCNSDVVDTGILIASFDSGHPPSVTNNYMGHLSLYAWIYSADDDLIDGQTIRTTVTMVDYAERKTLKPFFKEAVLDKGLAVPLAARFCHTLLLEHHVDEELRSITSLLSAVSVHCEPVLHVKVESSPHTLMQCIRIACQRQLCWGAQLANTGGVLGAGLSVIK